MKLSLRASSHSRPSVLTILDRIITYQQIFIPLLCMVSLTLAEPPVGDGYPAARSDHHGHDHDEFGEHHHSDDQRSLSQGYGPPSSRNSLAPDYDAPDSRSQNLRGRSQFPPPSVRVSFNQRFSSAASRNVAASKSSTSGSGLGYPGARSQSQEYSAPNARSGISEVYGPPRSSSQEYNSPSARSPSTEYGVPNSRSSPSEDYGVPVAARNNQSPRSPFNPQASAFHDHSAPASRSFHADSHSHSAASSRSNSQPHFETTKPFARSSVSQSRSNEGPGYDAPRSFGRSTGFNIPSSTYGTPSSRSLLASYSAPSAMNTNSQSQDGHGNSVSETYGAPDHDASQSYAGSNARGLSQEYGVPSSRSNLKTEAIASSYTPANARSAPSATYLPSSRSAMPSQEYGVPDQDRQEYEDAQARALSELLNQEPANYDFAYQIEDQESGSDFGHSETREENRAQGSYFVVLPDGTKQTVEYEADERGFKPRISVEPAAAGYDDNAQDLARSTGGPY